MTTSMKIEHNGNSVYAVLTDDGPAIYPSLAAAAAAVRSGSVVVSEGDREYYEARTWHLVRGEDLATAGL
jgi:hypothetical protein